MYITQTIAEAVKTEAKKKKITIKDLLSICELNINTISDFSRGQQISLISFARIADILDCSVDYLLGRTDNPLAHKEKATYFSVESADNNSGIIGSNNSDVSIHNISVSSKQAATLLNLFNELDPIKQAKLLVLADELANS